MGFEVAGTFGPWAATKNGAKARRRKPARASAARCTTAGRPDFRQRPHGFGSRVQGSGLGVLGLGCRGCRGVGFRKDKGAAVVWDCVPD